MNVQRTPFNRLYWHAATVTLLTLAVLFQGCGSDEPATEAPDTTEDTTPAETPQAKVSTQTLLSYTPAEAQIAMVLPNVDQVFDRVTTLYKKIEDAEVVDERIEMVLSELAVEIGALEAETLSEIFAAKGIAADMPVAIYVDGSPTTKDADAEPGWAVALSIKDMETAKTAIQDDLIDGIPELSVSDKTTEEVNGFELSLIDEYAYFIQDDIIYLGFANLVKGIAARHTDPIKADYGSSIDATTDDAAVIQINGSGLITLMENLDPDLFEEESEKAAFDAFLPGIKATFEGAKENTFITAILKLNDSNFKIQILTNGEDLPGVYTTYGKASPLRFTQLLPQSTRVYLSARLNDETRAYMKQSLAPAIASGTGTEEDAAAQTLTMANQVIDMVGEELTIAVLGKDGGLPGVVLMIALNNAEISQGLIQMLVPSSEDESMPFGDTSVAINSVMLPEFPFPLSIAYPKDTVVASTDKEALKSIITHIMNGDEGDFLKSRTPPIDSTLPTYSSFYIDTKLVSELTGLAAMFGGPQAAESLEQANSILPVLREIRSQKIIEGDWIISEVDVILNPDAPEKTSAEESTE